jgi:hypothetical protein
MSVTLSLGPKPAILARHKRSQSSLFGTRASIGQVSEPKDAVVEMIIPDLEMHIHSAKIRFTISSEV